MPSVSKRQQRKFGAELRRRREGKKPRIDAPTSVVKEFAETKRKGLPNKKRKK